MIIPYAYAIIIVWLGVILKNRYIMVFFVDPIVGYRRGYNFWYYSYAVVKNYYVLISFSVMVYYRKVISKSKQQIIFFYSIALLLSSIMQLMHYGLLIESFGMSLVTLVYFFFIQKPEELVDSNTETLNSVAFQRFVKHNITGTPDFSCISIFIDDTIFIANTFGINKLNSLLKDVGRFLMQNFTYANTFYLNQGCFCVLIDGSDIESVNKAISILQNRFQRTWIYDTVELKLYDRLCVIHCPDDAESTEEVLDIINLVSTDERYRQSLVFANEIDLKYRHQTIYIEHSMRNGLTENRFDVFFQPIYSTAEKRLIGAEALVRLKDERGRFISPEDFIPIAEKTGAILRIGEYVFESVCLALSQINPEEYGIKKIDINLSVAQCMQEILSEQILKIQSVYQIPTSIINLEITETAFAHTPEILLKNMQDLSEAGFELSLDDYGSGYSNMNYMLNLPFKMIKIDKYIVWAAFVDKRAETALAATIKMIKSIGMTVLAEGVESKEQADWLIEAGCDYLQGYYFSRPIPKKEFLDIMKKGVKDED
ncbi:MAG: EAL domain-containing protein [Treponema sp.]|nr:EAL domain-containing protein [Treponema sp.]